MSQATVSELTVGTEIPVFQRATGLHNWNRYAAVNSEFVDIHMDDEAGKAAGYPTAFGMGNLQWSYLHALLRQWIGDNGRILRLGCQFRSPNTKGQIVTAHGKITAIREEDHRIHGISDTTIGHTEEIKKTLDIVKRYGSYGWPGQDFPVTKQCKVDLEEDFQHLVEQTDLLWDNRDKMAAIRQKNSEARWNSLTNAFTYL